MIRGLFHTVSQIFPYSVLEGMVKPKIVAPFYHTVSDVPLRHLKNLYPIFNTHEFKKHLEFFLKRFQPVAIGELSPILMGEKEFKKPGLFLSFDDGLREIYSIVEPILSQYGVPATFFVNPNFVDNEDMLYRCKVALIADELKEDRDLGAVINTIEEIAGHRISNSEALKFIWNLKQEDHKLIERFASLLGIDFNQYLQKNRPYMTLEQLTDLSKKGYIIGAHSVNHPLFSEISLDKQIDQVERSVDWVQQHFPNQPKVFAFPFTNHGVDRKVYNYFIDPKSPRLDFMFGTAGHKPTDSSRFLHRIPMEIGLMDAKKRLKGEFFYYLAKGLARKQNEKLYATH